MKIEHLQIEEIHVICNLIQLMERDLMIGQLCIHQVDIWLKQEDLIMIELRKNSQLDLLDQQLLYLSLSLVQVD